MPASSTAPDAKLGLLPSLGRLVRGLSALFWGLPIALVVSVQTLKTSLLAFGGILPPLLANGLLLYGLLQMGHFQSGERVWRQALDRAVVLALTAVGLSPFLYWSRMMPDALHYRLGVGLLALTGLLFLFVLNLALQRLAAMLPDETLRLEARMFTGFNIALLLTTLLLAAAWQVARNLPAPPPLLLAARHALARLDLLMLMLLILLPLALTMTLIWKIKEAILASLFQGDPG